jgi:hypothetical protein
MCSVWYGACKFNHHYGLSCESEDHLAQRRHRSITRSAFSYRVPSTLSERSVLSQKRSLSTACTANIQAVSKLYIRTAACLCMPSAEIECCSVWRDGIRRPDEICGPTLRTCRVRYKLRSRCPYTGNQLENCLVLSTNVERRAGLELCERRYPRSSAIVARLSPSWRLDSAFCICCNTC